VQAAYPPAFRAGKQSAVAKCRPVGRALPGKPWHWLCNAIDRIGHPLSQHHL